MGVQVPRLTVKADFGEEKAFGELSLVALGLGLHQSWVYSAMFGDSSVFGVDNFIAFSPTTSVSFPYVVSICVYIACLLVMGVSGCPMRPAFSTRKATVSACACASAGTLLLAFAVSAPLWPLQLVSGILTGIGSSLLIILWGSAYARCSSASIVLNTAIAVSVAIFLYAFVLHVVPIPASGVLAACVPMLELPLLLKRTPEALLLDAAADETGVADGEADAAGAAGAGTGKGDAADTAGGADGAGQPDGKGEAAGSKPAVREREFRRPESGFARFIVRFATPVLVFGIALGILRQNSLQGIVPAANVHTQVLMVFAAGLATVVLLLTIVAVADAGQWTSLFRALVPFIAVTVFFVPLSGTENWALADVFLLVGFLCFEALLWIFFAEVAHRCRLSPVLVFGVGRGVLALAILLGSFLPITKSTFAEALPFGENGLVVIILTVLVVAYALLPRENEIESLIAPVPQPAAPGGSKAREDEAAGAVAEPAGAAQAPQAANSAEADAAGEGAFKGGKGRFRRKCDAVAGTYMLSQRESEVMFLLAKGYNAASLQDKLYISEGTAKTHIRHIYRKLDIHSQQELIRIIDNFEEESS